MVLRVGDDDEAGAVVRVVLNRRRDDVQAVLVGCAIAGNGRERRLQRGQARAFGVAGHRAPLGVRQVLIHSTADPLVPLVVSQHYRQVARHAGDHHVQLKKIQSDDHFVVIMPSSPKWPQVIERIVALVQ